MAARGADLVAEALVTAGVRRLFSLSGNQILSVYDATIGTGIGIIHTRHEAAAVHMADGWGRLTEQPGVALVTAGPGHCNALSALYVALMAESPVVLLSGHCPRSQIGRGAFQEIDQVAAARPVTKAAWLAEDPKHLDEDIAAALALACAGRPGPVHLSLPSDLLESVVPDAAGEPAVQESPRPAPVAKTLIGNVLHLLAEAKRPLILAGPAMGRTIRWKEVERLSGVTTVPALLMESPRGVNDPWLHAAKECLIKADLVLLLGKKLDFSLRFGRPPAFSAQCRFIQVGDDAEQIGGETRVALTVRGDPPVVVSQLTESAQGRPW